MTNAKNWAYGALTMNSDQNGVGTIYYTAAYFQGEGLVNPVSAQPYTAEELETITSGKGEGKYVDAPENALIGMSVNGTESVFWYDAETAKGIVSHADPLALGKDGVLKNADGTAEYKPM